MKVNLDTFKTTGFVLKNRLLGYKLLQNPKGSNPYEQTMIKKWHGATGHYLDRCYRHQLAHCYKEGDKFVKDNSLILDEHFINPETTNLTDDLVNINGYTVKHDVFKLVSNIDFEQDEMRNKPLSEWGNVDDGFFYEKDHIDSIKDLYKQNREQGYLPRPGFLSRIATLGAWKEILGYEDNPRPIEPSFLHVLITNLNGGGIYTRKQEHYGGFWHRFYKVLGF